MDQLRQESDASLSDILNKGQIARLRQIQLQLEGPRALIRPDMIEKLNMDEFTVADIQQALTEERAAQREVGNAQRNFFRDVMKKVQAEDQASGNSTGNQGQAGAAGNNANNANGNRGNRRFNPELMKKAMAAPEVQERMKSLQGKQDEIRELASRAILGRLSKRQRGIYAKMLGAPFDRTKMGGRGPWGGPGGPFGGPAANATARTSTGSSSSTANTSSAGSTPTSQKPAAAKPKRKSLREIRGSSSGSNS